MKHKLLCTLGLIVLGWAVFAAVAAEAFTWGVGSYYATPSWDQTLTANVRFIILTNMSSQAILDNETGLVWEKSPSTTTVNWEDAQAHCNTLRTGNRMGWRLPTIQELASLVDPSVTVLALPIGHPFSNVQPDFFYWSATTDADFATAAWSVLFANGVLGVIGKSSPLFVWCVRGGKGVDFQ